MMDFEGFKESMHFEGFKKGPINRSIIKISNNYMIYTDKTYNWLQIKMWKILLNVDIIIIDKEGK